MWKKLDFWALTLLATCALAGTSCNDDETPIVPALTLTAGTAAENSLSFTISPENATAAAYAVIEDGEAVPSSPEEVFKVGKAAETTAHEYTAAGLPPATTYTIVAAAKNETVYSPVKKIRMTTGESRPDDVSVTLTARHAAESTLSFILETSDNAESAAYVCFKKGETVPAADLIFDDGAVAEKGEHKYTVEGLEKGTEYIIAAAARAGDALSPVATLEMATTDPWADAVPFAATDATIFYYGESLTGETGTCMYVLNLNDIVWNEQDQATTAGTMFALALHGAAPQDPADGRIPSGTYTFDLHDSYAAGTFDNTHSYWAETNQSGVSTAFGQFLEGTITVAFSENSYDISAFLLYTDGRKVRISWQGPIEWKNRVPLNYDLTAASGTAIYYGTAQSHSDSDKWVIKLYGEHDGSEWTASLELYASVSPDWKHPELPAGSYRPADGDSYPPGVYYPGSRIVGGTYLKIDDEYIECMEGPVAVSGNSSEYTFTCDFTTDKGVSVKVAYTGALTLDHRYSPELGQDVDIAFDRAYRTNYFGVDEESGLHHYYLHLADSEMHYSGSIPSLVGEGPASVGFFRFVSATGPGEGDLVLPEGVYEIAEDERADICNARSTYLNHWDSENFFYIVTYISGTVAVKHVPAGYEITLDATDSSHKHITGTYTGALTFTVPSGAPSKEALVNPDRMLYSSRAAVETNASGHQAGREVSARLRKLR